LFTRVYLLTFDIKTTYLLYTLFVETNDKDAKLTLS